jgi:hypothetical protein
MKESEKPKEVTTSPLLRIGIASLFVVLAASAILFASREFHRQSPVVSPEDGQGNPTQLIKTEELD